jgi:segregation and condensation protein A
MMEKIEVRLDVFEGPLDLLLYLIKKNKMDIYDIKISIIADQYIKYLNTMKKLNMEIATEFMVMASTLMYIKSRMLLPVEKVSEDDIDVENPEDALVEKLVKYKIYKEVAKKFSDLEDNMIHAHKRDTSKDVAKYTQNKYFFDFSFYEMLGYYKELMKKQNDTSFHQVIKDDFTVEEKINYFKKFFKAKDSITMTEIIKKSNSKMEVVVYFLAILELARLKILKVKQSKAF